MPRSTTCIVAHVGTFQGYEQTQAGQHLIRAFRKGTAATPGALAQRRINGGRPGEAPFLLSEVKATTGAEEAADLRGRDHSFSTTAAER